MAISYLPLERDQLYLLPPDVREWLPEDHLAYFVIEVVGRIDTSALHARHANSGPGRAAYNPEMFLALVIYAYATGVRSSRRIERACESDVAFRVICANHRPDHSTIARFRQHYDEVAKELFCEVLELLATAGLAKVGLVAVDGTKMAANASMSANKNRAAIEEQVRAIFAEAERTDAEEDEAYGTARGDEPPAVLRGRAARKARLEEAMRELESRRLPAYKVPRAEKAARAAEAGQRIRGRTPKGADRVAEAEAALAAVRGKDEQRRARREEAEREAARQGRRLRGTKPSEVHSQVARAEKALEEARGAPSEAKTPPRFPVEVRVNTTDPESRIMKSPQGFVQAYNAQAAVNQHGVVLAAEVSTDVVDRHQAVPMMEATSANLARAGVSEPIGTMLFDAGYWSEDNATAPGPTRLIAISKSSKLRKKLRAEGFLTGPPPEGASITESMEHRLRTAEGAALYAKRSTTVEPIFGQLKEDRGYRRFLRRGLRAVNAEWQLMATAHNVNKLFRASLA